MSEGALFQGPAIRVQQRIGTFWAASIPADVLLACTARHGLRMDSKEDRVSAAGWNHNVRVSGSQRELDPERLRAIAKYVDGADSTFPNTIILAAQSDSLSHDEFIDKDELAVGLPWRIERSIHGCDRLVIPIGAAKASIVDGQHRLFSFLHSQISERQQFELLCSVFFDIPLPVRANIFATINTNQKPVPRGTALQLYGYNLEDQPFDVWSPEKLAVFIVRRLNFDTKSPLHHRVKIDAEGAPEAVLLPGANRALTLASLIDGVLRLISQNSKADRDALRSERFWPRKKRRELAADNSPLRTWYREGKDADLYALVRDFVGIVDSVLWNARSDHSMLTRAVGVRALFDFLAFLLARSPGLLEELSTSRPDGLARIADSLQPAAALDFTNPFFEATGRGQKRILNALLLACGLRDLTSIEQPDREELAGILKTVRAS